MSTSSETGSTTASRPDAGGQESGAEANVPAWMTSRPLSHWSGRQLAVAGLVFAIGLVGWIIQSPLALGLAIATMGLACLAMAARLNTAQIRKQMSETRGHGALLGKLISILPGFLPRLAFGLLALGITALGAWAILAGLV